MGEGKGFPHSCPALTSLSISNLYIPLRTPGLQSTSLETPAFITYNQNGTYVRNKTFRGMLLQENNEQPGFCDAAQHEHSYRYHPDADYRSITACPEVFYLSHTTGICQTYIENNDGIYFKSQALKPEMLNELNSKENSMKCLRLLLSSQISGAFKDYTLNNWASVSFESVCRSPYSHQWAASYCKSSNSCLSLEEINWNNYSGPHSVITGV